MAAGKSNKGKASEPQNKKTLSQKRHTPPPKATKASKVKTAAPPAPVGGDSQKKAFERLQQEIGRQVEQRSLKLTSVVERLERELATQKKVNGEIQGNVIIDELTQLFNRRGFLLFSEHHLKLARRASIELVFLFVHAEGDYPKSSKFVSQNEQMIRLTGELVRGGFRTTDIVGRLDDEVLAVLAVAAEKGSSKIIVMRLRERLQSFLRDYNAETNGQHDLKFRVGIMRLDPRGVSSVEELIEKSNGVLKKCRQHGLKPSGEILTLASYNRGEEVAPTAELMTLPLWDGQSSPHQPASSSQ